MPTSSESNYPPLVSQGLVLKEQGIEDGFIGKRQNQLTEAHIAKIIATYQFRKEEPRYSRRVEMAEIEKNDFNLNISRYISTATAEEEIILADTHAKLVEIEQKIQDAARKHNEFLDKLGLSLLPSPNFNSSKE